ncbi:MAG TPA: hypothetical protein PLK77_18860, partial [Pyrinomonadaceae bacterium]|nr:hypothetical protein [Pyrinomonadaceae bacterium]
MRIAAVAFVASFVFVGLATLPAFACSYIANPDPPIEYIVGRTETVFFGTLIQKRVRTVKEDGETYRVHSLLFRVDESFKGKKDSRQTIEFWEKAKNLSSCDVPAPKSKVGQQWVVFIGYDEGSDMLRYVRHSQFLSWHYEPDTKYDLPRLDKTRAAALKPRSTFYGQVERAMLDAPQAGVILNI